MKALFILPFFVMCTAMVSAFAPLGLKQSHIAPVGLKRSCPLLKMSSETPLTPPDSPMESDERDNDKKAVEETEGRSQPSLSAVEVGLKERQAIMAAEAENSPGVLASKALNFVLVGYIAYLFIDSIRIVVMGASSGPPPV